MFYHLVPLGVAGDEPILATWATGQGPVSRSKSPIEKKKPE